METKLCSFFILLKETEQFFFLYSTQKSAVSYAYTAFPQITKKTNHIETLLTGTDYYNYKISNLKDIDLLFSIYQKHL